MKTYSRPKAEKRIQYLVHLDSVQAEALERASQVRDVSKQELLRLGVEMVTHVPSTIRSRPPNPNAGFANPDQGKLARAREVEEEKVT